MEMLEDTLKQIGQAILAVLLVIGLMGGFLLYEYLIESRNSKTDDK